MIVAYLVNGKYICNNCRKDDVFDSTLESDDEVDEDIVCNSCGDVILRQNICHRCETQFQHFRHNCPSSAHYPERFGCPECDDYCSSCR
jgi:DNA-directed RNA polymerase subunit RPC12/RpoP